MKRYTTEADTYYYEYQPRTITRISQTWAPIAAFGLLAVAFTCMGLLVSLMAFIGFYHRGPIIIQENDLSLGSVLSDVSQPILVYPTATPVIVNEERSQVVFASAGAAAESDTDGLEMVPEPLPTVETANSTSSLYVPQEIVQQPVDPRAFENLNRLMTSNFPARDYFETHVRLGTADPTQIVNTAQQFELGAQQELNVLGRPISVELIAVTPNLYFWVDQQLEIDVSVAQEIANQIEQDYLPPIFDLFGQSWLASNGLGLDGRINIVHLNSLDSNELGFFDSSDQYPTTVFAESNEHEAIYINMSDLIAGDEYYFGTVVHEIQHLIQWHNDKNEETWLDEGLSQLAEVYSDLNSFEVIDYINQNDIQLNSWSYTEDEVYSHYSASALFMIYLYEQLGPAAVTELAQSDLDGMASVASVVQRYANLSLDQFMANWLAAIHLNGPVGDQRYDFEYEFRPVEHDLVVSSNLLAEQNTLHQFSGRYVSLTGNQIHRVSFAGDTLRELAPIPPYTDHQDGTLAWYAPPRNKLNAQLTTEVDLAGMSDLTLSFDAWFEFEENYDFIYVLASTDGGSSWEPLNTRYASNSLYGPAMTGYSVDLDNEYGGWLTDSVSLEPYRGQAIQLRFEVVTDSTNAVGGVAIDNIQIGETFFDDVEGDLGSWISDGFVQVGQTIPQKWSVQLVRYDNGISVETLPLNDLNQGEWILNLEEPATLIVAPLTPFVNEMGRYWLSIESHESQ